MAFALAFLGSILAAGVAIVVVAAMHAPDTTPAQPAEPPLPDGNERGDDLLYWCAEHPDSARAPEYLEDL